MFYIAMLPGRVYYRRYKRPANLEVYTIFGPESALGEGRGPHNGWGDDGWRDGFWGMLPSRGGVKVWVDPPSLLVMLKTNLGSYKRQHILHGFPLSADLAKQC